MFFMSLAIYLNAQDKKQKYFKSCELKLIMGEKLNKDWGLGL